MSVISSFSIRVYGCAIKGGCVLVANEHYDGESFTKFPGGGVEFGEGLKEALAREWQEELGIEISVKEHFYTQDFFQVSAFDASSQIITVYYIVDFPDDISLGVVDSNLYSVQWLPLSSSDENITFPVDKIVFNRIKEAYLALNSEAPV